MDRTGVVVPYRGSYTDPRASVPTGPLVTRSEGRLVTRPEGRLVTGQVVTSSSPAGDEPDPGHVLRVIIAFSIAIAYLAVGMVPALALFGSMVIVAIIVDWLSDIQLINMVASRTLPPSPASVEQSTSPIECIYFNCSLTNSALSGRSLLSCSDEIIISGWQLHSAPSLLGEPLFLREALFQGKKPPQLFVSEKGFRYLSSTPEVHHWYAHEPSQASSKNVWTETRFQLEEHPAFTGVLKNLKTCRAPVVLISNLLRCAEISFSHQRPCVQNFREPVSSNFFALQAPELPKNKIYTFQVLSSLAETVYTAFRAIKQEALQQGRHAAVHIGNWGCAKGHNPLIIALIQLAMAQFAEIDEVHYYPHRSMKELTDAGQYLARIKLLDSNSPELAEIGRYNRGSVSREGPNSITIYGFLTLLEAYAFRRC